MGKLSTFIRDLVWFVMVLSDDVTTHLSDTCCCFGATAGVWFVFGMQ